MRKTSFLIAFAGLAVPVAAPAADGAMGPTSRGSVTITASVAPRAWAAGRGRLCVAAPPSGFSLRLANSPEPLGFAVAAGPCAFNGQAAALPARLEASGDTLLIVAE